MIRLKFLKAMLPLMQHHSFPSLKQKKPPSEQSCEQSCQFNEQQRLCKVLPGIYLSASTARTNRVTVDHDTIGLIIESQQSKPGDYMTVMIADSEIIFVNEDSVEEIV